MFPSIPNECLEQWVLDQFVIGLNNHKLKTHVKFGHPKNLNEAFALALEYESFERGIVSIGQNQGNVTP